MAIKTRFQCVSHPTFGIVLLGGLKDKEERLPFHNSAGLCYSLESSESVARTTMSVSEEYMESKLNGEKIDPNDSRSPFKMIEEYKSEILKKFSGNYISVISSNENIISGSSDAGAAALGKCIQTSLGNVSLARLERNMRKVSESAGRSFYGGLTVTEGTDNPVTKQILGPEKFSNYYVLSAVFPHKRKPSDDIHFNQPRSNYYPTRVKNANKRVELLKQLSLESNIKSIWELAMQDTDDYHYLNSLVDVQIVTDEMQSLMDNIKTERKKKWLSYIVTGGNSVFVIVEKQNLEYAMSIIKNHTNTIKVLTIVGGAKEIKLNV